MLSHGIPKLEMLLAGGEIKFMDPIGLGILQHWLCCFANNLFCIDSFETWYVWLFCRYGHYADRIFIAHGMMD
ncbi:hypothetical protein CS542_01115 [Pedobacter sp. IW39]|nr:hypothetical protein CS542_01115 [Pedobacter sp. IW39]